jgi:hypothetical protein
VKGPDGEGAAEACRALLLADEVTFSQEYLLDRYEVPLALVLVAEGKPVVHLVASEPLARLDPR